MTLGEGELYLGRWGVKGSSILGGKNSMGKVWTKLIYFIRRDKKDCSFHTGKLLSMSSVLCFPI